jgi:cytochrome c peroxidase
MASRAAGEAREPGKSLRRGSRTRRLSGRAPGPAAGAALLLAAALGLAGCDARDRAESEARATAGSSDGWDAGRLELLRSLSLRSLARTREDPSNRVADDPRAARLGHRLFFDPSLSASGAVACASCHRPERAFSDGLATSVGLGPGSRNAPTLVGAAHSPWLYWDGRRDSLWAQALAPLEASNEMGSTRLEVVRRVANEPRYRAEYEALFGVEPDFGDGARFPPRAGPFGDASARDAWDRLAEGDRDRVNRAFANVGKAIAAYERLLAPAPSRFDAYVGRLQGGDLALAGGTLEADEIAGLRLFVDGARTQCLRCHNGPLFTNHGFHDVASSRLGPLPDLGRFAGLQAVLLDPFNCLGRYSDAPKEGCAELRFLERRELATLSGAFKTPTLREVGRTAPYFHDGSLETLEDVVAHYRRPPADPGSELVPLELSDREAAQLAAFLRVLAGGVAAGPAWLAPPGAADAAPAAGGG